MRRDDPEAVAERRRENWRCDRWDELRANPALLAEAIDDRTYRQSPGALLDLLEAMRVNEPGLSAKDQMVARYSAAVEVIERLIQEVVDSEVKHEDFRDD